MRDRRLERRPRGIEITGKQGGLSKNSIDRASGQGPFRRTMRTGEQRRLRCKRLTVQCHPQRTGQHAAVGPLPDPAQAVCVPGVKVCQQGFEHAPSALDFAVDGMQQRLQVGRIEQHIADLAEAVLHLCPALERLDRTFTPALPQRRPGAQHNRRGVPGHGGQLRYGVAQRGKAQIGFRDPRQPPQMAIEGLRDQGRVPLRILGDQSIHGVQMPGDPVTLTERKRAPGPLKMELRRIAGWQVQFQALLGQRRAFVQAAQGAERGGKQQLSPQAAGQVAHPRQSLRRRGGMQQHPFPVPARPGALGSQQGQPRFRFDHFGRQALHPALEDRVSAFAGEAQAVTSDQIRRLGPALGVEPVTD